MGFFKRNSKRAVASPEKPPPLPATPEELDAAVLEMLEAQGVVGDAQKRVMELAPSLKETLLQGYRKMNPAIREASRRSAADERNAPTVCLSLAVPQHHDKGTEHVSVLRPDSPVDDEASGGSTSEGGRASEGGARRGSAPSPRHRSVTRSVWSPADGPLDNGLDDGASADDAASRASTYARARSSSRRHASSYQYPIELWVPTLPSSHLPHTAVPTLSPHTYQVRACQLVGWLVEVRARSRRDH